MTVITIEYQMGCGGRDIGRKLADQLNLNYIDREIVKDVARELHISEDFADMHDERVEGVLGRTLTLLSLSSDVSMIAPPRENDLLMIDETIYHNTTCRVIKAAARSNQVVIVGHGASFALADWPGVMRVGLYAPFEQRVATVRARLHISQAEAQRRTKECDCDRARYIKRFYQKNWHEADHYHLLINTVIFERDRVVDLIAQAWHASTLSDERTANVETTTT